MNFADVEKVFSCSARAVWKQIELQLLEKSGEEADDMICNSNEFAMK